MYGSELHAQKYYRRSRTLSQHEARQWAKRREIEAMEANAERVWTEAPSSATIRCTIKGYDVLFTLRDDSGRDLLAKVGAAIDALEKMGATAEAGGHRSNGHKANGNGETKMCSIHNAPMSRFEKNGQAWYSHKVANGVWCKGK
jgi:hypothetical protein